jgi:methylenetetrahydrofolate dehydrogenase (NADP+) / methenyltetrahydrofolate cyclohydrolase
MTAKILDGRAEAQKIRQNLKQRIQQRSLDGHVQPGLDVILVGNNPASATYVKHKQRCCEEVGIRSTCHYMDKHTTVDELTTLIKALNNNPETHGILLQLPLPSHLQSHSLLELINPNKDVDGFHPFNIGQLVLRHPTMRPCTPYGVIHLLEQTGIELAGANAVIVGASNIVGRPMALECLLAKSTVTVCHRFTKDLAQHIQQADILISAIGKPGVIQSDWIKPNAIVIDVGFNHLEGGIICGDIDFESAKHRASWITPVPGGVGPMTIAILLKNTLQAAEIADGNV